MLNIITNMKKEKEANSFFKDFFANTEETSFIYDNIDFLSNISSSLVNILESKNIIKMDEESFFNNCSLIGFNELKNQVEQFYSKLGININIDEMIESGKIKLIKKTDNKSINIYDLDNYVQKNSDNTSVHFIFTGHSYDIIMLIHELAHYLDDTNSLNKDSLSYLLSEVKAISTELISYQLLPDNYEKEINIWKNIRLDKMLFSTKRAYEWSKYIKLYKMPGHICKRNFVKEYGSSKNYEKFIRYFWILSTLNPLNSFSYMLSEYYGPYILNNYNSENSNYNNIFKQMKSLEEFYNCIGADSSEETNYKLLDEFNTFVDETLSQNKGIVK